jgi:hypothetical protein
MIKQAYALDSPNPNSWCSWCITDYPQTLLEVSDWFATEQACRDHLFRCFGPMAYAVPTVALRARADSCSTA